LGLHQKPIGLLNINGFYNDLIKMLETMVRKGFLSMDNYSLLLVDSNPKQLLKKMEEFKRPDVPKWLNSDRT
jgi:predicted Rossmann-fold nucleotide-binding protein